jgi:SAM-dependent methyltransferase
MSVHFDSIVSSYTHSMKDLETVYDQAAELLAPIVRDRVVLDVGAGGRFAYDVSLPAKVIALDLSANMLAQIDNPRVEVVVDDASTMHSIPGESVDVAMFCLVLHHINAASRVKTLQLLTDTLTVAAEKLRPGGHIVVLEVLLPPWLYWLEASLFGLQRMVLRTLKRDMIFLYKPSQVQRRLELILSGKIQSYRLVLPDWYDPLAGSFPGKIRIPGSLSPTPFRLFVGEK